MKVYGQNIPNAYLIKYQASLQVACASIESAYNFYGNMKYNEAKYGSHFYVKTRYPFKLPHMQGGL